MHKHPEPKWDQQATRYLRFGGPLANIVRFTNLLTFLPYMCFLTVQWPQKLWKSEMVIVCWSLEGTPVMEVEGYHPRKMFENVGRNMRNLLYCMVKMWTLNRLWQWPIILTWTGNQWTENVHLSVQFRFWDINLMTSGHQNWHIKLTLFCATFKSGTEFTIPAVQVPWSL